MTSALPDQIFESTQSRRQKIQSAAAALPLADRHRASLRAAHTRPAFPPRPTPHTRLRSDVAAEHQYPWLRRAAKSAPALRNKPHRASASPWPQSAPPQSKLLQSQFATIPKLALPESQDAATNSEMAIH